MMSHPCDGPMMKHVTADYQMERKWPPYQSYAYGYCCEFTIPVEDLSAVLNNFLKSTSNIFLFYGE